MAAVTLTAYEVSTTFWYALFPSSKIVSFSIFLTHRQMFVEL
jgi:hypothetical protein